jgi:hypothetical protein
MFSASTFLLGLLRVFLDCSNTFCHEEYLREEVELADYVRDRTDADVHVLITSADTAAGGEEFTLTFIGLGTFQSTTRTLKVTTEPSDTDDRVRRQLASALTVGLLAYLAPDSVPSGLEVSAELAATGKQPAGPTDDPWRRWIFSMNGNLSVESEESTSDRSWGVSFSADRITPEWKVTIGADFNEERSRFNLDEEDEEELSVVRKNRSVNWLVVKGLDDHWSVGLEGQLESSTFSNTQSDLTVAPAVEWNFFPYSMYTRRQLRVKYAIGASRRKYYEITLFGKIEETLTGQELSTVYEQNEPWGTLESRLILSNYFPGLEKHRVEVDGEVDLRITRGLSLSLEASASRIRDQLSLPRRDASPEEVLLRLRELQSGFEVRLEFGIEYQFGSRFAAIVNPRFGQ